MSLNSVALCGRVTDAGVKLSYMSSGHPETQLTLVVDESGKDGPQPRHPRRWWSAHTRASTEPCMSV